MRNEKTTAAAIEAVQNSIRYQGSLVGQVDELVGSLAALPEGTLEITENGTHDVSDVAKAEVNVKIHSGVTVYGNGTSSLQLPAKAMIRENVVVYAPIGVCDADSGVVLIWIYGFKSSDSRVCYTDSDGIYRVSYNTLTISGSGLITVADECGVFPSEVPYVAVGFDW